ncbi:MAG: UPF0179 family protein [Candidatus Hydrothermarchaeales archaeon]
MIALVDKRCAREGYEFVYLGESEECERCAIHLPCHHNLENGRRYVVTAAQEKSHPCQLFEEVVVCEVQEVLIDAAIEPVAAFAGASFTFRPIKCDKPLCSYGEYCMPEGLRDGDRCTIEAIKEKIRCKERGELVIAALRRT